MKSAVLAHVMRLLFAIAVLVGSILTLNYGLEKGTNPPLYLGRVCDFGCGGPFIPTPAPGPLEQNRGIALILVALGVFILSKTIFGNETKNFGDYRSSLASASNDHWAAHVRTKQRKGQSRDMRKLKRVRL